MCRNTGRSSCWYRLTVKEISNTAQLHEGDDGDGHSYVDDDREDDVHAADTFYGCDHDAEDNGDDDNVIEGETQVLMMTILMKSHQPAGRG